MATKNSRRVPTLVKHYDSELAFLSDVIANKELGGFGLSILSEQRTGMAVGHRCRLELWLPTDQCLRAIGQLKWLAETANDDGSWSVILSYGHLSEADSTIVQALQWKHRDV